MGKLPRDKKLEGLKREYTHYEEIVIPPDEWNIGLSFKTICLFGYYGCFGKL